MSLILLESGTNKNATKNPEITQPSHYCISGTLCHRIEVENKKLYIFKFNKGIL